MTDLTRSSTSYKFSLELYGLISPSLGATTPTVELTSSLEAATSTTSQLKKNGDLFFITNDSQVQSYNQNEEVKFLGLCGENSL